MATPPQPQPQSILKSSPNARSGPSEMSVSLGKAARIVMSEDEDEDNYQDAPNKCTSDGEDEDAVGIPLSDQALELLHSEKALKSGYLLKKGEKRRTWKKRWFVLRTTKLAMYKDSKEYKLLRIIDLHEIHSVVHVTSKDKYKYMFAISTPKRMYYLQADNQMDMTTWIEAIERAKAEQLLYDADDDTSSIGRDQAYASDVTQQPYGAAYQHLHQRKRSSGGDIGVRRLSGGVSLERRQSGISGHAHVPPVDIPRPSMRPELSHLSISAHTAGSGEHGLSSYSTGYTYPMSPVSTQHAQMHLAEGLASSEDEDDPSVADELASARFEEDRNRTILDGYLLKLGRNKGWKKRFFVLRTDSLSYYEDSREYKVRRIIPLTSIIDSLEIEPMSRNKTYCFKIIIPKRSYVLCASSQREMDSWLDALTVTVRRAKKGEAAELASAVSPSQHHGTTAQGKQQSHLQRLATGSSVDSIENTSHISGVSGAGAVGGAGGALPGRQQQSHVRKLARAT